MIIPERFRCDAPGCGMERTPTNHWWLVMNQGHVRIYRWEDAEADHVLDCGKHFCGQTHALQYVSSLMGEK
jgi:hypothetical protein